MQHQKTKMPATISQKPFYLCVSLAAGMAHELADERLDRFSI